MKLCWAYRGIAAASGPKVGEKQTCSPRPLTLSSESFCRTVGRRLDHCKRRVQQTSPEAPTSDTKRRKLDGRRKSDIKTLGDWNIPYPIPDDESWLHPTEIKSKSDHQLATTVMTVQDQKSSATTEVGAPRSVITGFQRTESKSKMLQLARVREELSNAQGSRIKGDPDDSVPDDVKVKIDQTEVNARSGLEFKAYAGNGSVVNGSVRKYCDAMNSFGETMLQRPYPHKKSAFLSQHNTVTNLKPIATVENKTLELVNSKNTRHGLHSSDCTNGNKMKLESSTGFLLAVDSRLQIVCVSGNVWNHLGCQQIKMLDRSLEEYIHPSDLSAVRRLLKVCNKIKSDEENVVLGWRTVRPIMNIAMPICLQGKSTSCRKELGYTLVEWNVGLGFNNGPRAGRLVGLCRPVGPGPLVPSRLEGNMFTSRHDLSFRFTSCDHRLVNLTGYEPEDLFGWAPYHFISPWDAAVYKQSVQALMSQGASISRSYRFLSKSGVWVGMVTQATVVYDTRSKPRYIVCKNHIVRDERIQQKQNKEKEDFLKMKCLSFCVEDELSAANQLKLSQSSTTNKQNLNKLDSDLVLKQFFDSDQSSNLVSPWCRSTIQETFISIPSPNVTTAFPSNESFFTMAVDSSQNVSQETAVNDICDYCIPKTKLLLDYENKSIQYEESTHAQQTEGVPESVTSICEVDMLDTGVDSCPELTSQRNLPVDNTVDTMNFDQVFECCNPVDKCSLTDAFPEQSWIQMEASDLGDLNMADCQRGPHQGNADITYAESAGDTEYQTVQNEIKDNRQGERALDAHSALEYSQQCSHRLNDLCLPRTPWMMCNLTHESILSPTGDNLQKISESDCFKSAHQTTETSRNILSGKCASILQLESAPTSSSASTLRREFVGHCYDYSQDEKNALSNACAQTNLSSSSYQHNNGSAVCFESDFSSDSVWYARQISPSSNIPSSDSVWCAQPTSHAGNIPSSVSKLPIVNHEFLSSPSCHVSACETHQDNSSVQYGSSSESENPSLCNAAAIFSESDNANYLNSFFSMMTNIKYDPFLNQTSFNNLNPLNSIDQTDDVDSSKCPVNAHLAVSQTSQIEQGKKSDFENDEINHSDFSSAPYFVVSETPMSDALVVPECFDAASLSCERMDARDTFLCNSSSDTCSATCFNRTANCQAMLFPEHVDCDSHLASDSPLCCRSNDSSDSDTSGSTSLLRTLLDKEEKYVQGPLTYAEWIFEQALKKKCDIKKTKISYLKSEIKHTDNKRGKNSRSIYRKSVDMPLPASSHSIKLNISKSNFPQKPTKELPLPVSTKATTQQPSLPSQENNNTERFPQANSEVNNDITENNDQTSQDSSNDFDLPDDLLDMAMEYCASIETDQDDGLITDLTDHFLSEDHFNSLCGSPPQDLKSVCSPSTHNKPGSLIRSQSYSVSSSSTERNAESSTNEMTVHLLESGYLNQEPVSNLRSESSQNSRNTENNVKTRNSQTNSARWGTKMSLLRTAVMTPDVDKLIEHIPLPNSCKYSVNNRDILVPKSAKLQEHSIPASVQVSHGNLCKIPSVETLTSPDASSLLHPHKHFYKHTIKSGDKPALNYVCKTSLSKDSVTRRQHLSHCLSTTSANGFPKPKSGQSRFVLKISIHQDCSSTVTNSNKSYENSINQKFKNITSHTTARAAGVSVTDSSATQPVSVIIMRKENNRSRRSKSIAIQTDNDPGEKFPDFEHSPSDTFLYPSVIVCSPSSTTSEECDMSPSTSQLSPTSSSLSSLSPSSKSTLANMRELEKSLYKGYDSSSSSRQEGFQTIPNASFLQRLLMGQLSKDQYQHLDKQMMEAEKRVILSSAVL
ncbi:hypothetical protein BsWGS_14828 [Bradybaena similaris]